LSYVLNRFHNSPRKGPTIRLLSLSPYTTSDELVVKSSPPRAVETEISVGGKARVIRLSP
jgi:hypothetical protein